MTGTLIGDPRTRNPVTMAVARTAGATPVGSPCSPTATADEARLQDAGTEVILQPQRDVAAVGVERIVDDLRVDR